MSLVIKKFADGGSPEVRTYRRGSDEVNLNAFIRLAEMGFNDWLDKTDLKEKHKKEVRSAYQDMITRIHNDPESFVARSGGGFTNTAGITNKTKGFDAYGVAAGYLGNTLRGMSAYTKPEVKSDKPKYKRLGRIISPEDLKEMLGDDFDSFIRLDDDSYDKTTGLRGLTHRLEYLKQKLENYSKTYKDRRDFDSDEDRLDAELRLGDAIARLNNDNPNDDWFALSLLGFTDINRFLSTGIERSSSPLTLEEQDQLTRLDEIENFEEYMSSNRPFYTGTLLQISLDTRPGNASAEQIADLLSKLRGLDNKELRNWIFDYIEDPTNDFTYYPTLMVLYNNLKPEELTSGLVMSLVLENAIYNGLGRRISDTMYYFPDTLETYSDNSSTVFVYDLRNRSLKLVDTLDIKDYRDQYLNEYWKLHPLQYRTTGLYSSRYPQIYSRHKEGGILKALEGIAAPEITIKDPIKEFYDRRSQELILKIYDSLVSPDWARLQYGSDLSGDEARARRSNEILPGWKETEPNLRTPNIGTTSLIPSIENAYRLLKKYINSGNLIKDVRAAYLNWLLSNPSGSYEDFAKVYNSKVNNVRRLSRTKFDKGYNSTGFKPLFDDYNWLYSSSANTYDPERGLLGSETSNGLSDINGSTMFFRNSIAFNGDEDSKDLRLGTFTDEDLDAPLFWIDNDGNIELRYKEPELVNLDQKPELVSSVGTEGNRKENLESTVESIAEENSDLNETQVGSKKPKTKSNSFVWEDIGTGLLGAGRLAGSILTNNKIADTVKNSLKPKLHDTYELYSPVTGAFSERLLRDRQASEILSQAYKPFTSDASLMSARMLEALRQARELLHLGFLADDREVRRTQLLALLRQESNIARRSALANKNRDAIIANNQAIAQLEASRDKQNWNSIDNYLKGVESRVKENLDYQKNLKRRKELEDEYDKRNFILTLDLKYNASKYQPELDLINELIAVWEEANPTKSKEKQSWYKTVSDRRTELADRLREDNIYSMALRRGWDATNRYHEPGRRYDSGEYEWSKIIRRNGGTLKLSSSQLIDKIIKKNESNS